MAESLKKRTRRNINLPSNESSNKPLTDLLTMDEPTSDLEIYSKEVLGSLIADNLPPTPSNFSLYFDRLLEDKSENLRKQIISILELEESNDDENTIILEQSLKKGFGEVKNILGVTANLYKNISLMTKILDKRKIELKESIGAQKTSAILDSFETDLSKLNSILLKQNTSLKTMYDTTAQIVKHVQNETIFDNQYGVYNKRYLMTKIEQEIELLAEFKHKSSLIMIELSKELKDSIDNTKVVTLMTRTIARLLLKTSRRSDTVAHYGSGIFVMLLKHTDIKSAQKASERLCDLVANSNFFLADRELQLKISVGITDVTTNSSVEEIVVSAMDGMEKADADKRVDYAVSLRNQLEETNE